MFYNALTCLQFLEASIKPSAEGWPPRIGTLTVRLAGRARPEFARLPRGPGESLGV